MHATCVKAFVDAAAAAASARLGSSVPVGETLPGEPSQPVAGVAALVGLTGALRGRLMLDLDATAIASLLGAAVDRPRAVADLAEDVAGRAIASLRAGGMRLEATPPVVFTGRNLEVTNARMESVSVRIGVPAGMLVLSIAATDEAP